MQWCFGANSKNGSLPMAATTAATLPRTSHILSLTLQRARSTNTQSNGMFVSSAYAGSKTASSVAWYWKKASTIQLCQPRSKERGLGTERPSFTSSWESVPETRNLLKKLLESFGEQRAQNWGVRATIFGAILWAEASMHGQVQIHKLDHPNY